MLLIIFNHLMIFGMTQKDIFRPLDVCAIHPMVHAKKQTTNNQQNNLPIKQWMTGGWFATNWR